RLTRDHSLMELMIEAGQITPEEAKTHPQRSVITRALGSAVDTYPDIYELNIAAGDRLLLCSDGLSNMVSDKVLLQIMTDGSSPEERCRKLVRRANENGGKDNISAIVIDFREEEAANV
ncbi:MAG: serine/threonine-protein phosphatase, partial [Lachnospiraceae bacterium]|nr:serine/threonine-protein phosphatase [Lachnospiraceae bacterium]